MIDQTTHFAVNLTVSLGTLVTILVGLWKFSGKFHELNFMVRTMWTFFQRRGFVEGTHKHMFTQSHGIFFLDETWRRRFEPLREALQEYYLSKGRFLSPGMLRASIEDMFGFEIVRQICMPHNLTNGSCIEAAILLAREAHKENTPAPEQPHLELS